MADLNSSHINYASELQFCRSCCKIIVVSRFHCFRLSNHACNLLHKCGFIYMIFTEFPFCWSNSVWFFLRRVLVLQGHHHITSHHQLIAKNLLFCFFIKAGNNLLVYIYVFLKLVNSDLRISFLLKQVLVLCFCHDLR